MGICSPFDGYLLTFASGTYRNIWRYGEGKREKRKEKREDEYDMQDGPTSRCLCLASLGLRQAGASVRVKGSIEGGKGGVSGGSAWSGGGGCRLRPGAAAGGATAFGLTGGGPQPPTR